MWQCWSSMTYFNRMEGQRLQIDNQDMKAQEKSLYVSQRAFLF